MRDDGGLDHGDVPSDEEKMYLEERSGSIKYRKDTEIEKEANTILILLSILIWIERSRCHCLKRKRLWRKLNHEF